jgi:hypothetical protein
LLEYNLFLEESVIMYPLDRKNNPSQPYLSSTNGSHNSPSSDQHRFIPLLRTSQENKDDLISDASMLDTAPYGITAPVNNRDEVPTLDALSHPNHACPNCGWHPVKPGWMCPQCFKDVPPLQKRELPWRTLAISSMAIIVVLVSLLAFLLIQNNKTSKIVAKPTSTPTALPTPTVTLTPVPPTATPRPSITFDNGFTNPSIMRLVGRASFNGSTLRLTHSELNEASGAYYTNPMYIDSFSTTFTYQAINAKANGFTFAIQGDSPVALGSGAGNLGYAGINKSVAVLFKFYDKPPATPTSTTPTPPTNVIGMGTNGQLPSSTTPLPVPLYSGHLLKIDIQYKNKKLDVIVTDAASKTSDKQSYTVNIPSIVGSDMAYIGFTGGTGSLTATQDIVSWHYQS